MVINRLIKAWVILAKNNLQNQLLTLSSSMLFIVGKFFNFIFTLLTIYAIFSQANSIQGYSLNQAVIVVIIYNLLESISGFLFRSLYTFRPILLRGDFDMDLLKPLPSYFRPIFSGPDFLDLPLIIIQFVALVYYLVKFNFPITLPIFGLTLLIFLNAIILAFSIHLSIAAFSIITTEIDSLVALYRNFGRAAVVPTDIYSNTFRFILNYIVPITVLFTLPAKAILNVLSTEGILYSCFLSYTFFLLAINFWRYSLRQYTSASS